MSEAVATETYTLKVMTPEGEALSSEGVSFARLPGVQGEVGILANHSPMICKCGAGALLIQKGEEKTLYFLKEGIAHVERDNVLILAPFLELPDAIDKNRAQSSKERALKRLQSRENDTDKERARAALIRADIRLSILDQITQ